MSPSGPCSTARAGCLLAGAAVIGCSGAGPAHPSDPLRAEVTIPGDGVALGGILIRPEGASGPRPAVMVLHGWLEPGVNGAETVELRARQLADSGYIGLALSLRGWPPSGGGDDCGLRQPDDVIRAVQWLAAVPGVDSERIGLVGFSQGGQVALLAGARGAPVRTVVAYYPVTDVARWKATTSHPTIPDYITAVCEPGGVAVRSPRFGAATMGADVLLIHGDADTRVPTEQSVLMQEALAAAGRPVALELVPAAQHGFTAAEEAMVRPVMSRFLADRLR